MTLTFHDIYVPTSSVVVSTYAFQTPLDLNEFRTNNADALPLLHFILHTADFEVGPYDLAYFMGQVITNPSPFFEVNTADGLDCTLKSSSGQKAGEMFPRQATEVLCCACFIGDVTLVKGMLAAGTDINQCNAHGRSPLWHASGDGWNSMEVIDVLLSHGVNVRFVNESLVLACKKEQWPAAIVFVPVHHEGRS